MSSSKAQMFGRFAALAVVLGACGSPGWQAFHALGTDVTHTNDAGALVEAGVVRELLVDANLPPLVRQLR